MIEKANIQFENIDNVDDTLKSLYKLFEFLLVRYKDREDESLLIFIDSIMLYFSMVSALLMNDNLKDNKGEENEL